MEILKSNLADQKISKLNTAGIDDCFVVADFDGTITQEYYNAGNRQPSGIALLRQPEVLLEDYYNQAHQLFDKYHVFENDTNLSLAERQAKMYQWWDEHQKLIIQSGLTEAVIDQVTRDSTKLFRAEVDQFLQKLNIHQVPTIIFSAGVTNIIQKLMEYQNLIYPNINIVANNYTFNPDGSITAPTEIIHSLNKNQTSLGTPKILEQINGRKNVILLGNGLGDSEMIDQTKYSTVLKIAFLDKPTPQLLVDFQNAYDIVITDFGDFGFVNQLLEVVCG